MCYIKIRCMLALGEWRGRGKGSSSERRMMELRNARGVERPYSSNCCISRHQQLLLGPERERECKRGTREGRNEKER